MQEGLALGMGEGSNGGISTLEGQARIKGLRVHEDRPGSSGS